MSVDKNGIIISISKIYTNINEERGPSWYDHKSFIPKWNPPDPYYLVKKVGRGKYSTVFKATDKSHNEYAIKILVPLEPRRYLREIKILTNLQNQRNIVKLEDLVIDPVTGIYSLVFEWVNFFDWRNLYNSFTPMEIRLYLFKLLEALDCSHSNGIMHRDIKPQNIAIDKESRRLRLLDWGLADFYYPKQKYSSHVATRIFKPPELLICYPYYDYSIDIWSAGLTFSIMLFKRIVIEYGESDAEQLLKIGDLVGGESLIKYARSLNVGLSDKTIQILSSKPGTGWEPYIEKASKDICTPEAIHLLKLMMTVDHRERITAKEAMKHPFFLPLFERSRKK